MFAPVKCSVEAEPRHREPEEICARWEAFRGFTSNTVKKRIRAEIRSNKNRQKKNYEDGYRLVQSS